MADCNHIVHPEHWSGDCGDVAASLRNHDLGGTVRVGAVIQYGPHKGEVLIDTVQRGDFINAI